ncbi:acyl-CoA dehydrogenase family protein [Actinospongicola halichondriae]|uniref:acyl-CoA dehydrogenase family protein n=1 Tax=Actinospongicola halichondriae TaxID=3236844 RepID=UPI003D4CF379
MTAGTSAPPTPSTDELLERARGLRSLLVDEATASDESGHMSRPVAEALFDSGLMTAALPQACGGAEADLVTQVLLFEELSAAEPAAGWSHMACATSTAFAAAFMADATEMFADGRSVCAGQFAPRGSFQAVDGGYRVTGEYGFASGSGHAAFIMAGGAVLDASGEMVFGDDGMPEMRVAAIPRDEVTLAGGWHVLGLQGTGSQDYSVDDVFVPTGRTFELFSESPLRGGPQFSIGIMPMTSAGHAGWALGVCRRALEEIASLAAVKQRMGASDVLAAQQLFQKEFGEQTAQFRSARAYVLEAFGAIQAAAETDGSATLELKADVRVSTTHATRVAADVILWCYRLGGGDALRDGHPLQRCMRDILAGTQHIFVDDSTYVTASQVWLDRVEGFVFL